MAPNKPRHSDKQNQGGGNMEILTGVIILAIKLICECCQEKEANKYADMVVRRYKEE